MIPLHKGSLRQVLLTSASTTTTVFEVHSHHERILHISMKIVLFVLDFASHVTWAQGYASREHDVRIKVIPSDRWKFRFLADAATLVDQVAWDDDFVMVDGMLDVTVLVALLKSRPHPPKILLYLHENQCTTPFVTNDRDVTNQTHWHYGMAHYRSLCVVDGCIFNSRTHCHQFAEALPRVLNQQAPRNSVEWHLSHCRELLQRKCMVLPYGLDLQSLQQQKRVHPEVPVILWNARLQEDKDPATFIDLLQQIRIPFRLIVLGSDPSKNQVWYARLRDCFADQLLFVGWCTNRTDYAAWLQQATIVVSTARHETFGISVVESVYAGALPLLPRRLSYPELFGNVDEILYKNIKDAVEKLSWLLGLYTNDFSAFERLQQKAKACIGGYDWSQMTQVYDDFFWNLSRGDSMQEVDAKVGTAMGESADNIIAESTTQSEDNLPPASDQMIIRISDADDSRVQLFRPKSLRNHQEYHQQLSQLRQQGPEPALHGGRRAMVRMLEAISMGAKVKPIALLTNDELSNVLVEAGLDTSNTPLYIAENQELLNEIRGQKLNSGDSILSLILFPIASELQELIANPPLLILEDVRNAENVGSILRTAFCLGIKSVVASSTAWASLRDTRAARCSMGTMYYHQFYKAECLADTIRVIQESGITVYGVEIGENAKPIAPHGSDRNWAAVMGNEDLGLTTTVGDACDRIVLIPQAHGDSLNVGHAAAITMFELGREAPIPVHDGRAACM